MQKIVVTSNMAHFKVPYASKYQKTYDIPPISTVIGMLKVIFGEEIDNFIFGYTFEYESKFQDTMLMYKVNVRDLPTIGDIYIKNDYITDSTIREYLYNCTLKIYTDIDLPIQMNYCLTMGKSNNLARLHLPFKKVNLVDAIGTGYNQFTPIHIGTGIVKPITYYSKYDKNTQSFITKTIPLRFNKEFEYDKHYDEEEGQNIFLWKYESGEIHEYELS